MSPTIPSAPPAGKKARRRPQPLHLWVGNVVHRFLQTAYRLELAGHPVVCERRVFVGASSATGLRMNRILDLSLAPSEPDVRVRPAHPFAPDLATINYAFRTEENGYRRPDILNLETRDLLEIKPRSRAEEGRAQVGDAVARFNAKAAELRATAPAEPEWAAWRSIRDIRRGWWIPPPVVFVGFEVVYAWLEEPGLILYDRPRRKRRRNAMRALREMEREERDLVANLRAQERRVKVLTYVAIVALLVASRGRARGGGGAGTGIGRGAERVIGRAGRTRPPHWDVGPRGPGTSQEAAGVIPLLLPDPSPLLPPPPPPSETALTSERAISESEFVADAARSFLERLPLSSPGVQARALLVDDGSQIDLVRGVLENRGWDLERLLLALAAEEGGLSRMLTKYFPEAVATPHRPEDFADLLLANRDFMLSWNAFELLLEEPDEAVGVLVDEEYDELQADTDEEQDVE